MSCVCPVNGAVAASDAKCPRRCPVTGAFARTGAVCPLGHSCSAAAAAGRGQGDGLGEGNRGCRDDA